MDIIVSGSIAFDYLMHFPGLFSEYLLAEKLDRISVSFLVDNLNKRRGGVAANIAYSLALLGEKPVLCGAVGNDFGPYREWLENAGVDTRGAVEFPEMYTASFFANTDRSGNQISSFYSGAMQLAGKIKLGSVIQHAGQTLVVISPNDPGAMIRYVDECIKKKIPYVFDPSQQVVLLGGDDLMRGAEGAQMMILNEYELEIFLKKTAASQEKIAALAGTLVVTLGDKGARIHAGDRMISIPAVAPKKILDPTGVGDAFRAGLLKGLALGLPWEAAGRMGSLAAAYVLETEGPQSHHYTYREFVHRYCTEFGDCDALKGMK